MKKFYNFLIFITITIISTRYIYLYYFKHNEYYDQYINMTNTIVYGLNAPRGRIIDRNGNVLVDNIGVSTIVYRNYTNNLEEVTTYLLNLLENIPEASLDEQLNYYLATEDTDNLLTAEEKEQYSKRKLTLKEIESLKKERITTNYDTLTKQKIYLTNLLEKGYSYDAKIIQEEVSSEICAKVNEKNISGLTCEYTTKRVYLYDTLNNLYGTVGNITKENKEYYLDKGYSLNDLVGLSYIEKEYDDYLKGEKAKYILDENNNLILISEAKQGQDIYLTIDINLQLQINEIIKENLTKALSLKNTKYYNRSYVIVSDPNTGELLATTGIALVNGTYLDVTKEILTNSFTVGSIIKGASHTVGYQNNLIEEGKLINDSCVKLYQVPTKCSFKRLGYIDDITALKTSSNYYQFITAIKSTGNTYTYNMELSVTEDNFKLYRDTFASFGLGSSTGIDLENESLGITGSKIAPDLLLNLSIGQYDTYTPLQLTNYINTIATSGQRYALHYLLKVSDGTTYEPKLLNTVENSNFPRIIEGMRQVLYIGTGRGYTDTSFKPAGKTGTSEVVYDANTTTINQSYAMFAPYDSPKYSIVVLSPNISYNNDDNTYIAPINRYISKEVSNLVFSNY